ncbi:MAG: DUF4327 family protein [Microcoleaceae cyanobacterium]
MSQKVLHPMEKFQRQVASLIKSDVVQPTDSLWKISLLFGKDWTHWKQELLEFGFSMQDPICELLAVEGWDED